MINEKTNQSLSYLNTPSSSNIEPPIDNKKHELPIEQLRWEDFEKLCLRIVQIEHSIENCEILGVKGQKQEGIDIFAIKKNYKYSVYQCKKYQKINKKTLEDVIDEFKKGEYYTNSDKFIICTSANMNTIQLQSKFNLIKAELKKDKIEVEKWDKIQISRILKEYPKIVNDFFGKEWVRLFNGVEIISERPQNTELREEQNNEMLAKMDEMHRTMQEMAEMQKNQTTKIISHDGAQLQSSESTEDLIIKMGNNIILEIDELLKANDFESALRILDSVINTELFINLKEEFKAKVLFKKSEVFNKTNDFSNSSKILENIINEVDFGLDEENIKVKALIKRGAIYLRFRNKDGAEKIYNILLKTKGDIKEKHDYYFEYGLMFDKEKIVNDALIWLKINNNDTIEQEIKKARLALVKNKTMIVKELLLKNNLLKKEYKDNFEANYIVGFTFLVDNDYDEAKKYLGQSLKLKDSFGTRFFLIQSEVLKITNRKGAKFNLSEADRIMLNQKLDELNEKNITNYFEKGPVYSKNDFLRTKLMILFFIDDKKALKEINELDHEFRSDENSKDLIADILLFNEKYDEAEKLFLESYAFEGNPETVIKLINIYKQKGLPEKAIALFENLQKNFSDEDGRIHASIIPVLIEKEGLEKGEEIANNYFDKFPNGYHMHHELGIYYAKNNNKEKAEFHFQKLCALTSYENPAQINIFAEDMLYFNFTDLALVILHPIIDKDDWLLRKYLKIITSERKLDKFDEVRKILDIKRVDEPDNTDYLKLKIDLEYFSDNKNIAYPLVQKLFEIEPTVSNTYNLVILMHELGKKGFSKYARILEKETNSKIYTMMAAICYSKDGNRGRADELSYNALALNSDEADESHYMNYLSINFGPSNPNEENEEAEQKEIKENSAVYLTNKNRSRWIIIETDKEIIEKAPNRWFIGGKHYFYEEPKVLKLLGFEINSNVQFEDKEYIISEITTRKTRAIRFCFENVSDSDSFMRIEIDEKNPLLSLIPHLNALEEQKNEMLNNYNFKNDIGLPMWFLSRYFSHTLLDTTINILDKPNQPFYIGDVALFDIKNKALVFSQTTIIMLYLFDLFEDLKKIKLNISITKSTFDYFSVLFKEASLPDKRVKSTLGIDGSRPVMDEMTDGKWQARKEMFGKILDEITNYKVVSVDLPPENYDKNKSIIKMISKQEHETIIYIQQSNSIYVCDDLFLRKFFNGESKTKNSTNIVALIYTILKNDLDRFFELLLKFAEAEMLYIYSGELLIHLYDKLVDTSKVLGSESLYGVFVKVIGKSIKTKTLLGYYEPILLYFLRVLYERALDNYSEYVIKGIIKELYVHYSLNGLDVLILKAKIKNISNTKEMGAYFFLLLGDIISGDYV
jgi:tetratricopeptide (TPR) repeat protein